MRPAFVAVASGAALLLGLGVAGAADPIFDQGRLHEVHLVMDPADWASLKQNFRTNQYYAANIALDGEVVEQVGIRSRGRGSRAQAKPGLRVDFNKYVEGQEFHGYKSLVLLNVYQDASFMHQALAMATFEAMGIPAPQMAYGRLTVNGEYSGLYIVLEPIGKPFLKARLGEERGNLFQCVLIPPWRFEWRGDQPSSWVPLPFEPQTNESHLDTSGLIAFMRAVNDEGPDASFASRISAFIDPRQLLTYVATENALAELDGFVGEFGPNNFYMYQYGGRSRFVFLPWDKDHSFTSASWPVDDGLGSNVLTRRLTADDALRAFYRAEVKRAVGSFVNPRHLGPRLEAFYRLIREAALTDTRKPVTNEQFEMAVQDLRAFLAAREADVLRQVP